MKKTTGFKELDEAMDVETPEYHKVSDLLTRDIAFEKITGKDASFEVLDALKEAVRTALLNDGMITEEEREHLLLSGIVSAARIGGLSMPVLRYCSKQAKVRVPADADDPDFYRFSKVVMPTFGQIRKAIRAGGREEPVKKCIKAIFSIL